MALVATHLTTGANSATASTYNTASVAPPGQRLLVIAAAGTRSDARVPTVSGLGLTWTQVNGGVTPIGIHNYAIYLFTAWTGDTAPAPGVVSISWTANMTSCQWSLSSWEGVDNAGGPIVQSAFAQDAAGVLAPSLTLAAFASPTNGTWGGIQTSNDAETVTAGAGFTLFGQAQNGGPATKIASEGRIDADTVVDFGGVATTTPWGMVAAEIREAVAAGISGAAIIAGGGTPTPVGQKVAAVVVVIAGGGTPTVGASKTASTGGQVAGGGSPVPTPSKSVSGAIVVAGGGTPTPTIFKTASGGPQIAGGGDTSPAGAKGATSAALVAGGGTPSPATAGAVSGVPNVAGGGDATPTGVKGSSSATSIAGGGTPSSTASKTVGGAGVVAGGGEPVPGGAGQTLTGTATVAGGGASAPSGQKAVYAAVVLAAGGSATPSVQKVAVAVLIVVGGGTPAPQGSRHSLLGAVVGGDGTATPVGSKQTLTAAVVVGGGLPAPAGLVTVVSALAATIVTSYEPSAAADSYQPLRDIETWQPAGISSREPKGSV